MGEDNKLLLPFRGKALVRHSAEQLLQSTVEQLVVVTGHESERVEDALQGLDLRIVHNPRFASGMSSSVKTGVSCISAEATAFLIGLSDMPLLQPADYDLLLARYREVTLQVERPILLPRREDRPGNPVIFHASYRQEVLQMPDGPHGCKPVVNRFKEQVVAIDPPSDHFFLDMDSPEEYRQVSARAKGPK